MDVADMLPYQMTILIVEDHEGVNEGLSKLIVKISKGAVTVYSARTLAEGLALDKKHQPAVVLLDLILPDSLTWQETLAHVKEFCSPVIIITALDIDANDFEIYIAAVKAGAKRVFAKPMIPKLFSWLSEDPTVSFAARLLGTAGALHMVETYGPKQ